MAKQRWTAALGTAAVVGLLAQGGLAQPAQSQTCDQRQRVIGHLAAKYKEAPIAIGVTNAGGLVEVLSTGDGQTWTIIVSSPDGTSCLLATGEGWRAIHLDPVEADPEA